MEPKREGTKKNVSAIRTLNLVCTERERERERETENGTGFLAAVWPPQL